jgi:magnesium transporter
MMNVYTFNKGGLERSSFEMLPTLLNQESLIFWIDIDDVSNNDIDQVGKLFGFHPLAIEDARNDYQRPKVEEYDDHLFIIINSFTAGRLDVKIDEIDIFLGRNYVVTIHDRHTFCINKARERMERDGGFRHVSAEFVFYVILDTVVDNYFPTLEFLDREIEFLEDHIVQQPKPEQLERVLDLKRTASELVRVTAYQEDMFGIITRHQRDLFFNHDILNYYLRDVHDHLVKANAMSHANAESLATLVGLYMSSTSNRLNSVVNRLTIATMIIGVFTVISGFYGMNFERTFPAYNAPWGLPVVVITMIVVAILMVGYFKWKKLI